MGSKDVLGEKTRLHATFVDSISMVCSSLGRGREERGGEGRGEGGEERRGEGRRGEGRGGEERGGEGRRGEGRGEGRGGEERGGEGRGGKERGYSLQNSTLYSLLAQEVRAVLNLEAWLIAVHEYH